MRRLIVIGTFCFIISYAYSTTVVITKRICPICKTQCTFQDISSSYRSQFDFHQYLDWTNTQTYSFFICMNCYYSALKLDFDSVQDNKQKPIKLFLKTINFKTKFKDYTEIPVTTKLEIEEKIYQIRKRSDEFWCNFYRIMGYHYAIEKKQKLAKAMRFKALLYAHLMLADNRNKGREKEILYIIATMNYFTGQEKQALFYLNKAIKFIYINHHLERNISEAIDFRLSNFINEYPDFINEQRVKNVNY